MQIDHNFPLVEHSEVCLMTFHHLKILPSFFCMLDFCFSTVKRALSAVTTDMIAATGKAQATLKKVRVCTQHLFLKIWCYEWLYFKSLKTLQPEQTQRPNQSYNPFNLQNKSCGDYYSNINCSLFTMFSFCLSLSIMFL